MLASCMDEKMYCGRPAVHFGIFYVIGQDGPLSASQYSNLHFQQGVPGMVSETKFRRYYPERGTRDNVTHAGNGREVHLAGIPNVKVNGYCGGTNEVARVLLTGCLCMLDRQKTVGKTEEALQNRYEVTKARLQKIENAGYQIVTTGEGVWKIVARKYWLCKST